MAATGVNFDVRDVSVAYTVSGTATTVDLKGAMRASIKMEDKQEVFQPGGARFATVSVIGQSQRGVDLQGADCKKLASIPRGVLCVVTFKIPDAENGLGEGCLLVTLNRAKIDDSSFGGKARDFAMAGASFSSTSADGNTDPLVITEQGPA